MTDQIPSASVRDSGPGSLQARIATGGLSFLGDEPTEVGGTGLGPNPYDLLCAALATCTALTVRLYADHKSWPLEHIDVHVVHRRDAAATPPDVFARTLTLAGPIDEAQRERLTQIAERCPVHRTLTIGARIETHTT